MKTLTIKINNKTYITGKITTFLSKEAIKIQKAAIELGKKGKGFQENKDNENLDKIDELLDGLLEIKEKKTWLICETFNNQFTADELEKALSDDEIDKQINSIIAGITGVIQKN